MGFLKSVIADARPAKSVSQSVHDPVALSGQPLRSGNSNSKSDVSGHNPAGDPIRTTNRPDHFSSRSLSSPAEHGLSDVTTDQPYHFGHSEADFTFNKYVDPAPTVSQTNFASNSKSDIKPVDGQGNDLSETAPPIFNPAHDAQGLRSTLPIVTVTSQEVESQAPGSLAKPSPSEIDNRNHHLPNPQQGRGVITVTENFSTNDASDETEIAADYTGVMTTGRHGGLNIKIEQGIGTFDGDNWTDHLGDKASEAYSEKNLEQIDAEIKRSIIISEHEIHPTEAISFEQHSRTENSAAKHADRQTDSTSNDKSYGKNLLKDDVEKSTQSTLNASNNPHQQQEMENRQFSLLLAAGEAVHYANQLELAVRAEDTQLQTQAVRNQQKDYLSNIETQSQLLEARSTTLANHLIVGHHQGENQGAKSLSFEAPRTAEVKIGQIDVFIEKSPQSFSRGNGTARPSPSLASRHYLRRL